MEQHTVNKLIDHILGGYKSSHEGIIQLRERRMVTDEELADLLIKNGERLIKRIVEFKIVERLVAIFFAGLFGFLQLTCNDLEMRKGRSLRLRRRSEIEVTQ